MSYSIGAEFTGTLWPHVEQAIAAAKRKANREGHRIQVFKLHAGQVADVWPDGKVDLTLAGSEQISIPLKKISKR